MRGCEAARWRVAERDFPAETEIARATGISRLVAAVLRNRGLRSAAETAEFLAPSAEQFHDPFLLPDLEPAIARLQQAIANRETVLVHGDYDADGLTGTALLCRVLSKFGCIAQYYIPHRVHEQYGLSTEAVESARRMGIRLLVSVDCGVSDHEAIAQARAAEMDVIVVDHHEPGPELPAGAWVVDPKREDSCYPERDLAGVGLAFKVASGLCQREGVSEVSLRRTFLDLVAVGTIADVVPLRGENRVLAALGLQRLPQTRTPGLRALLDLCGLTGAVRATEVAFRVAPRLNAVGRMHDATEGLELLLSENPQEARRLALRLDELNRERQREQETVYSDALRMIEDQVNLDHDRVIVLSSPDWHVGVVGIVASKILERFHRPVILLKKEGERLRGSARSVKGFNMAAALEECSSVLLRYGGHALAAGLTLKPEDLEEFRERVNLVAQESLAAGDLVEEVVLDAEVELSEITPELIEQLERLEPYGNGNPQPLLMTTGAEVLDCRTVGLEGRHLKLYVRQGACCLEAIGFGLGGEADWIEPGDCLDLCYCPEFNDYQGTRSLQLRMEALRPHRRR